MFIDDKTDIKYENSKWKEAWIKIDPEGKVIFLSYQGKLIDIQFLIERSLELARKEEEE